MRPSLLLGHDTHRDLAELLTKKQRLVVSGASNETAKALLLGQLLSFDGGRGTMHRAPTHNVLLVTQNNAGAEGLLHWAQFFGLDAQSLYSVRDESGVIAPECLQRFLRLMGKDKDEEERLRVFITTRAVWDLPFPSYEEIRKKAITLVKGQTVNFTELFESLIDLGYRHGQDIYLHSGEYRRQGDVLDIFPIQSENPYRLHFDFDVLTRIFAVDRDDLSQTTDAGGALTILPVNFHKEEILSDQLTADITLVIDDQDDINSPPKIPTLSFTAFPETTENHAHLRYLSVLKFYTLADFLNDIRDKLQQEWRIVIVTKRTDELEEIMKEERIPVTRHPPPVVRSSSERENERRTMNGRTTNRNQHGEAILIHADEDALLPHSLQNPDLKCALLTDREIFSLRKAGKQRSIQKLALDFITSLQPGDYVVHMEHGIGHFEGMTQKEVDGISREYLELTYAEGDKLFTPVDQADKLSKFVHEEGSEPTLTRLGTQEWKRLTEKMHKETKEIAKELLALYARRAKAKGHAFGEDTRQQQEFEAAFVYQETPGQMKAIHDIKADMESPHPMDRLICGDVGFGKTEVAMRAAFKAVQAGKQVAVVAPITILADQHYRTFQDRMKNFPITMEMLSRFRTPGEQAVILEKLRKGDIMIIIGTHRLLQDDVKFLNLGLVIIDEEQRFGVKQKEKFKQMRASVDILTLTATPIPRTLNLGLHKLRDITTITTPPPGRLPIITEVRKYSDQLVRQAILHEIERDGQCFVLHNRVETIDAFCAKLRSLVPEATFVVGHGQLLPDTLEERIIAFKDGKYSVLVSSTIIENGIDLPRANTLIVNEAERFGLSQLYQLRGRVGRSRVQAFAYFLYHSQKLQDDAKKRLRAIVEACELGSGFQVAMRDLEIRGAGEILGAEQSGTMQTVGVSHYLRMLKMAMEELKGATGEEAEEEQTVEIQLPAEAFIPSSFIPDEEEKISTYQKLAGSEDEAILTEFASDLKDEYGVLPAQVQSLFGILRLKMACRRSRVLRVTMDDSSRETVLTLSPRVTAKEIMQLVSKHRDWRISGSTLRISEAALLKRGSDSDWLTTLTEEIALLERKKVKKARAKAGAEGEI